MKIEHKYLWLPVKKSAKTKNISLLCSGQKCRELDLRIDDRSNAFFAYLDVSPYLGQEFSLEGAPIGYLPQVSQQDTKPQRQDRRRPKLHFTPDAGWINDPNGLVYQDGVYHLFFQHNPFGTDWGNMTWGHATSTDLFHWVQHDSALYPDETGTMFSGCGFVDQQNELGLGSNALLFYYTAAGGHNQWSKGTAFTQRLAVSTDGGKTLQKSDRFLLPHMEGENRDPKVFWHEASGAYCMVLFLDGFDFAVFRSADLLHWEQTQRMTLDKMWECPDLFELPVDGDETRTAWVFLSADGYYLLGQFDGYTFRPTSERLAGYQTRLPYAAQSYDHTSRRIILAWLRTANRDCCHTGSMTLPLELGLTETEEGVRLTLQPVKEIETLRTHSFHLGNVECTPILSLNGSAVELDIRFGSQAAGIATLDLNGQKFILDFEAGTITMGREQGRFHVRKPLHLRVFADYEVLELFANDTCYLAVENEPNVLEEVSCISDTVMESFDVHFLSSIL